MNWHQVCEDPSLQDLPYKVELNEYGKIVMSPADTEHAGLQAEIAYLIRSLSHGKGKVSTEQPITTSKGVKVPDVAWRSQQFFEEFGQQTPLPHAPELCVEVVSPSNSLVELTEKRQLYFESGANEVWFCKQGEMQFYDSSGERTGSLLFPKFPHKVD